MQSLSRIRPGPRSPRRQTISPGPKAEQSRAEGPATGAATPGTEPASGVEPQAKAARPGAPNADAEPRVGESGRWFRPAKAEAGFLGIPADEPADIAVPGAEPQAIAADASPGAAAATPAGRRRASPPSQPRRADQHRRAGQHRQQPARRDQHATDQHRRQAAPQQPHRRAGTASPARALATAGRGRDQARAARASGPAGTAGQPGPSAPPRPGPAGASAGQAAGADGPAPPREGQAPPDGGPAGTVRGHEEREAAVKRRISRRTVLQASLIGGAGVAALPLIALVGSMTRTGQQPTDLAFSMNTNWLFGGQYTSGSESSFFDDSNFAPVTLPHTVTPLSWQNWDYLGLAAGVDLPAALQRGAPARPARAGQPDPRRLRRRYGQRVGRDQRPGGQHASGRLPALLGRTHREGHQRRQPARGHRGLTLPAGAAGRRGPRPVQHRLLPARRHLPGRPAAGGPAGVSLRPVRPACRRAQLAAPGGRRMRH